MNVAVNLLDYLKKHDSAELIGIGTFKVKYTPASHSYVSNTITPPTRELSFVNIQNNNLGFVNYMASNEFISVETALSWITQYSNGVKDKLNAVGSYKIGEIGVLSKNVDNTFSFKALEGLNLLDESFAFATLKNVKTFDKEDIIKPIVTIENVEETAIEEIKPEPKNVEIEKVVISTSVSAPVFEIEALENVPSMDFKPKHIQSEIKVEEKQEKEIVFEEKAAIDRDINKLEEARKEVEQRISQTEEEESELDAKGNDDVNSIVKKIRAKREKHRQKRSKKSRKVRAKAILFSLFMLVLIALIASGILVLAHYMCWTKDVKFLEPITLRLNNYITPKCQAEQLNLTTKVNPEPIVPVETPTDILTQDVDNTPSQLLENKVTETPMPAKVEPAKENTEKPKTVKKVKPKVPAKPKISGEKDVPPLPTVEIDYTTPIAMQDVSRRGFDVVGGSFGDKANAQQAARKARSMGFDSYIISRQKEGKNVYYVSYGSRDTYGAASVFMKQINKKVGANDFYIISR